MDVWCTWWECDWTKTHGKFPLIWSVELYSTLVLLVVQDASGYYCSKSSDRIATSAVRVYHCTRETSAKNVSKPNKKWSVTYQFYNDVRHHGSCNVLYSHGKRAKAVFSSTRLDTGHTILWSRCIIRLCMKRAASCTFVIIHVRVRNIAEHKRQGQ